MGERPNFLFTKQTVKPLRILLRDGTGRTEPSYQVRYALSRGHACLVHVTPTRSAIKNVLGCYAERKAEVLVAWKKQKM